MKKCVFLINLLSKKKGYLEHIAANIDLKKSSSYTNSNKKFYTLIQVLINRKKTENNKNSCELGGQITNAYHQKII